MAKYMFLFRGGAFVTPGLSPTQMQENMAKWAAWVDGLAAAGHRVGGSAVHSTGKTIRGKQRVVTDGPYAESKDLVTGSLVITADSLDQAVALATGCPGFDYDGSVEVRPLMEREL